MFGFGKKKKVKEAEAELFESLKKVIKDVESTDNLKAIEKETAQVEKRTAEMVSAIKSRFKERMHERKGKRSTEQFMG